MIIIILLNVKNIKKTKKEKDFTVLFLTKYYLL